MKKLISFFLLFVNSLCYSQTLPFEGFDGVFYNPLTLMHHEGQDFDVTQNGGSEYQEYHGFLPVLRQHPYLYYPNFEVGVVDFGSFLKHEDFHKFTYPILMPGQFAIKGDSHGTLVVSIIGASQLNNGIGTHGLVNAKINFMSLTDFDIHKHFDVFLKKNTSKIVNLSYALDFCMTFKAYKIALENGKTIGCPQLNSNSVYSPAVAQQHIENVQNIRELIQEYPNVLFVFSAGNSGVDSRFENGAIHYAIDANGNPYLSKLPNVLVVGAIDNQGILTSYSNYGESVDIVALGKAYGAYEEITTYPEVIPNENTSGAGSTLPSTPSDPTYAYTYATEHGTSFAAPIVHGAATLMKSAERNISPAELKELVTQETDQTARLRYITSPVVNGGTTVTSTVPVPVLKLQSSYTVLKNRLQVEGNQDLISLNPNWNGPQYVQYLGSDTCQYVLDIANIDQSSRNYEIQPYGDRCLFFRGNSYVIDFDLITRTATLHEFSGYGPNKFGEYMTFRNFVNNLNTANIDNDWRINYGLMQNGFGHVSCSTVDTCVTNTFTTVEECKNLFKALTGDNPAVMGAAQTTLKSQNVCVYSTDKVVVEYDANVGEVNVSKKEIQVMTTEQAVIYLQSKVNYYRQVWISNGKPNIYYLNNQGDYVQFNSKGYPINFYTSVDNKLQSLVVFYLPYLIDKNSGSRYIEKYYDTFSGKVIAYFTSRGTVYII